MADEIESLLGDKVAALKDAKDLPQKEICKQGTDEWQSELERASDALWEIAVDRAGKLAAEAATNHSNDDGKDSAPAGAAQQDEKTIGQDVPFLSLASFRMLVLLSPFSNRSSNPISPNPSISNPWNDRRAEALTRGTPHQACQAHRGRCREPARKAAGPQTKPPIVVMSPRAHEARWSAS